VWEKSAFTGALFCVRLPGNLPRRWQVRRAGPFALSRIVLIRTKDLLVFGSVRRILVTNDASAYATICRAVP
jgi:hypothetical protein